MKIEKENLINATKDVLKQFMEAVEDNHDIINSEDLTDETIANVKADLLMIFSRRVVSLHWPIIDYLNGQLKEQKGFSTKEILEGIGGIRKE